MAVLTSYETILGVDSSNLLKSGTLLLFLIIVLSEALAIFFSKLRHFPGPFWARLTPFWLTLQCRRTQRSKAVMEQHGRFGDFVRIAPNHISINKVEALAQIYGHKTGFLKSDFYDAFVQVTPVVFNTRDVSTHQRKRRYMNPAFSARALSDFEPYMDAELSKWKRQLFRMLDERGEANLDCAVWTNFLAFDVIGSFAFGRSFGFIEKACDPYNLISTIDIRGEVLNALGTLPPWIRRYMRYNYLDTFWSSGIRATANLEKLGREAFHHRKDSLEDRKDLLSHLFAATDSGSKKPIHEEEIVAESISFIVGGSDTTSSTMTNFIDIVSRDRPWQEKLQQEIDAVYPGEQNDSWIPSEKDISTRLPFVVALLREVMRFRPTSATGLERVTPEGGRVIAGKFIPAKTVVSVPTCGIMMNAEIFENPKEFRPERWLEPDAGRLIEHFVPFSIGPRACIGRNFAWMEILKAVVLLFKLFDVERLSSESTVIREGFFNKAAECTVRIQKRRW